MLELGHTGVEMGGQGRRLELAEIETKKEEEGCSTERFLWPLLQTTVTRKHPATPWMASDELFQTPVIPSSSRDSNKFLSTTLSSFL